jgi:hypothetical protein
MGIRLLKSSNDYPDGLHAALITSHRLAVVNYPIAREHYVIADI